MSNETTAICDNVCMNIIPPQHFQVRGFTLIEMLMVIGILAVIATFTIPKILSSSNSSNFNAKAKSFMGSISQAYEKYLYDTGDTVDTMVGWDELSPYLNYTAAYNSTELIDRVYNATGTYDCTATYTCLLLHTGAMVRYNRNHNFAGTDTTSAINLYFDPDGQVTSSGDSTGPGKSLQMFLYADGRIQSKGNIDSNTCSSSQCTNPDPNDDPDWFSW